MLFFEFQIEMLKNIKYQNELLFKQCENIRNNEIIIKNILKYVNYTHIILNDTLEKVNINNILLVSIFILQIFILFK